MIATDPFTIPAQPAQDTDPLASPTGSCSVCGWTARLNRWGRVQRHRTMRINKAGKPYQAADDRLGGNHWPAPEEAG